MAAANGRAKRQRGEIETLPSGSLRVKVYAGIDPVTKRRHYLHETIPAGPSAEKDAGKARTRLLAQVDERRNPRTRATMNQLLDRWLEVLDVETSTRQGYVRKLDKHVRPVLGKVAVGRLDAETLESFYAVLRKCREHCADRKYVEHRKAGEHVCTDNCRPHACKPLSPASIRQIHWILSGALNRAVRWRWIAINPADHADKPSMPAPKPHPPTLSEAAALVTAAWKLDPDWGAFVWTAMTTGARRSELCALRWTDVSLDDGVVALERSLYADDDRELHEKETKTHQQRRVALDAETIEVLRDCLARLQSRCKELEAKPAANAFVFSPAPDGSTPLVPDTATQKFARTATKLGIATNLHALRHYSATELIAAGVDVRTVAGRLGHGGGGATTLRVYAAWLSESDQRAAVTLAARMPRRPSAISE